MAPAFEVGVYCVDRAGFITYANPSAERLLGWEPGGLLGRQAHETIHHSRPDRSPFSREECPLSRAVQDARAERTLDDVFWTRDGAPLLVGHSVEPLHVAGEHVGAMVVFADLSEQHRASEQLRARVAQQAALADLGLRALGGGLCDLFRRAGAAVGQVLGVEFSQVLQLVDEPQRLRLVAGEGWRPGLVGVAHVGLDRDSQAGYALACDEPAVVEDWKVETRFRASTLLREHGVGGGVSVVIHGRDRPWGTESWGVLGAHSRSARTFTAEDVHFLQSVANTLALAIERVDAEREVSRLAEERRRILADALSAEDRTRERISQVLHDEVLQSLLAARQDLATEKRTGSTREDTIEQARESVAAAIAELRKAVAALHPVTRVRGGLAETIKAIADVHARRGGFDVSVHVDPNATGARDQLIVSLAQELLSNVAQHAQASHVATALRRRRDDILFEVADDGHGMDAARPREALDAGHVGLASIAMRVEACGGRLQIDSSAGEGTRVRIRLPVGADMPIG